MQVGLHKLLLVPLAPSFRSPRPRACTHLNEVHLGEGLDVGRLDDVEDRDNVLVVKPPEELDLAERSEAEHCRAWTRVSWWGLGVLLERYELE